MPLNTRTRETLALIALGALLLFYWDSMFVWPLKIVVVMFHELGHAVAAWLTGGTVVEIGLNPRQGGHTLTQGGFRLLILNAGYLGSLLAGVLLLLATRAERTARVTSGNANEVPGTSSLSRGSDGDGWCSSCRSSPIVRGSRWRASRG